MPHQTSSDRLIRPPRTSPDQLRPPQTSSHLLIRPPRISSDCLIRPPRTASSNLTGSHRTASPDLLEPPRTSPDQLRHPQTSSHLLIRPHRNSSAMERQWRRGVKRAAKKEAEKDRRLEQPFHRFCSLSAESVNHSFSHSIIHSIIRAPFPNGANFSSERIMKISKPNFPPHAYASVAIAYIYQTHMENAEPKKINQERFCAAAPTASSSDRFEPPQTSSRFLSRLIRPPQNYSDLLKTSPDRLIRSHRISSVLGRLHQT